MQVNRLNLVFPPGSASPAGTAAAPSDAAQANGGKAQAAVSTRATVSPPAPAPQVPSAPAASGVTLALGSAQKVVDTGVYARDGMLVGRSTPVATDQTPAEHFVASAVNILRDFDPGTMALGVTSGDSAAPALPTSRFASLRQAVGKLNVFA